MEERTDCRITFTADPLIKAREFRLQPTFRKGERRNGANDKRQSVRPSLLAPLMVEQAKAIQMAKELAAMKSDDLERELSTDPSERAALEARAAEEAKAKAEAAAKAAEIKAAAALLVPPPAPKKAPELWEEAAILRRLLFTTSQPVLVSTLPPMAGQVPASAMAVAGPSVIPREHASQRGGGGGRGGDRGHDRGGDRQGRQRRRR